MSPDSKPGHLDRLDVLRGIAIFAVFAYHFLGTIYHMDHLPWRGQWIDWSAAPDRLFLWLFPVTFGWVGVSLFFVLSGFCIHWSFLRRPTFSTSAFYRARFWRIYPPYLIALIASALLVRLDMGSDAGLIQFGTHFLLIHNFSAETFYGINPAFWSLAAECQLYLAYPLFLWLRARLGFGRALLGALGLATAIRVGIFFWARWDASSAFAFNYSPAVLWFDWLLGAYLAERLHEGRSASLPVARSTVLVLSVVFVFASCYRPISSLTFTIASLLSLYLVDRCLRSRHALGWRDRLWMPLGLISYSFYLWHQPLIGRVMKVLHLAGLPETKGWILAVGFPITFAIIASVSGILYLTIERGAILIKNRRAALRPLAVPPVADVNPQEGIS